MHAKPYCSIQLTVMPDYSFLKIRNYTHYSRNSVNSGSINQTINQSKLD